MNILGLLANGLRIIAGWMEGYGGKKPTEARRMKDELEAQEAFDRDLAAAAKGDPEAADRVRSGINRNQ